MKNQLASLLAVFFLGFSVEAQVLGPSVQEVRYKYRSSFVVDEEKSKKIEELRDLSATDLADLHLNHLFGLFHSGAYTKNFGLSFAKIGGVGSPKIAGDRVTILSDRKNAEGKREISYYARGEMIFEKSVASKVLRKGSIDVFLPLDLTEFYDKNCTDPDYESRGDFWYFVNYFPSQCRYLQRAPVGQALSIEISQAKDPKRDVAMGLDKVRGDNGNGDVFAVYIINGYSDDPKNRKDDGRLNAQEIDEYFRNHDFAEESKYENTNRPLNIFTKEIELPNGKTISAEVHHLLVETGIESKSVTFAKFFKEAIRQADVIIYAGHSGLGGNLDIPSLEAKAGHFKFDNTKRQIFFFDSCSSYSYYLVPFSAEKTKSKIDILTYGLSSLFNTSTKVHSAFFDVLFSNKFADIKWLEAMSRMEKPLRGGSYLLSVGGI